MAAVSTAAGLAWDSGPAQDPVPPSRGWPEPEPGPGPQRVGFSPPLARSLAPAPARGPGPRAPRCLLPQPLQSLTEVVHGGGAAGAGSRLGVALAASYDSNVGAFNIVLGVSEIVLISFNSFFFYPL